MAWLEEPVLIQNAMGLVEQPMGGESFVKDKVDLAHFGELDSLPLGFSHLLAGNY